MADKITLELDGHKAEFDRPEGWEGNADGECAVLRLPGNEIARISTTIWKYDRKITDRSELIEETRQMVENLIRSEGGAHIEPYSFLTGSLFSIVPKPEEKDGREGRYIKITDASGKIVERYLYWLDDHYMYNIVFIYAQKDKETMDKTIKQVIDTLRFMPS